MAVVAFDCGGTRLAVTRVDRAAEVPEPVVVATPADPADFAGTMADMAAGLAGSAVGVSIAGLVADGDLVWMPHRRGGARLSGPLAAALQVPVVVENDANCAALAEATLGAGRGHRMVLMVTVGTGIGGGLVIDGHIERGRGLLGEIGHMTIDPDGPGCPCGKRGCWEAVASGSAMDRAAQALGLAGEEGSEPSGRDLIASAGAGDGGARAALGDIAMHFGRGLANMVTVFDPDVIVVGGGAGSVGEPLLAPARRALRENLSGAAHRVPTPVVVAALGERAGLAGAALIAGAPA